ncbi:MAG: xylulokinase [Pseudomonadota bacterium]|nr:xylulokinase [Pseudomonadota bacterium]
MYLGIDIGTSSVKAMLVDGRNAIIAQSSAPLSISRPRPLWSEQSPDDWWTATNQAVLALPAEHRRAVRAIGLSGQMHGATVLDADDRPLRPAILWNDGRSEAQCRTLVETLPEIETITGNLVMPGFTAPKTVWLRENEPDVLARAASILLPKDYVRLCMTGDKASDMSDAAGTSWLDVSQRAWSEDALQACGLDTGYMPQLFEGSQFTGTLLAKTAQAWGMDQVNVAAGGGDNAAGACGIGVVEEGDAFISLGTSGVIFLAGNQFRPNPARAVHAFCHALPDRWHQMTVLLSAASCLDWAAKATGVASAAALDQHVSERGHLGGTEIFLPYLSGERTPHNNPHARGVLFGLDHDSDAGAIGQAVMEGVAFAFADGLDALVESGAAVTSLSVIGGGAKSRHWGRVLAAALQRSLVYREGAETGPAFGAARLARLTAGDGDSASVLAPPPVIDQIDPAEADIAALAPKRSRFTHLYDALTPHFGD